ncbi:MULTISPECIES: IclR family transcriptional regulator [Achromobacter]|uniref:IclR family transcriptional regulator n=3 Tax=Achromobacter denitrificans TaxID=32002 RepID=A0A3R9FZ92_ACHDE|nr:MULTISPECIES: IclR family transcriptional regulator [Achromobacter]ASC66017.1 IclR family transcriptional regulator [Achromobacter denitrificans]OLU08417.1 transcriptional regulator [Achromobacter denitrificans]QCS64245.1 IclR family transcriptional regulator [Achromobacter denitrificans]QKH42900.1 IclR family transcriptional regulator [Achromobacter denitrificans]QKH49958.1 IclR family transcriptional regulator [Achromobacter denitrificans]
MSTHSSTGIQSAEIALDVLTRLAELGGALSVSELGRSLDMPRAKVHRYLVSLERRGYVEQDAASARYRLGPQALHTGLAALAEVDFVKLAAGGLDGLSAAIGQTVFISVWGQHGPTIVQWRDARLPVTVNVRVGSVLPLLNSATGRVYAAWLPETLALPRALAEWDALLGQDADAERRRDAARALGAAEPPRDPAAALRQQWQATRQRGYASVSGHLLHGIDSAAVPVLDAQGRLAGAITGLGLHGGFDLAPEGEPVRALVAAAADCSRRLGWNAAA